MSKFEEKVLAGGLWLDMMAPGWQAKIQWNKLDLASPWYCVLGQVFGSLCPCGCGSSTAGPSGWLIACQRFDWGNGFGPFVDWAEVPRALGFYTEGRDAQELTREWRRLWSPRS